MKTRKINQLIKTFDKNGFIKLEKILNKKEIESIKKSILINLSRISKIKKKKKNLFFR